MSGTRLPGDLPAVLTMPQETVKELSTYSPVKNNASLFIRAGFMALIGAGAAFVIVTAFTAIVFATAIALTAGALIYFAKTAWDISEFNRKEKAAVATFNKNIDALRKEFEKINLEDISQQIHLFDLIKDRIDNSSVEVEKMYATLFQLQQAINSFKIPLTERKKQLEKELILKPNDVALQKELDDTNTFLKDWFGIKKIGQSTVTNNSIQLKENIEKLNNYRTSTFRNQLPESKYFSIKPLTVVDEKPTSFTGRARTFGGKLFSGGLSFFMGASVGASVAIIFVGILTTIAVGAMLTNPITLGILVASIVAGGAIGFAVDRHLTRNQQKKLEALYHANVEIKNVTHGVDLANTKTELFKSKIQEKIPSVTEVAALKKELNLKDEKFHKKESELQAQIKRLEKELSEANAEKKLVQSKLESVHAQKQILENIDEIKNTSMPKNMLRSEQPTQLEPHESTLDIIDALHKDKDALHDKDKMEVKEEPALQKQNEKPMAEPEKKDEAELSKEKTAPRNDNPFNYRKKSL